MLDRRVHDHTASRDQRMMDELRLGADPVVWSNVSEAMRQVEARDSIVFRVAPVGRGWTAVARIAVFAAILWRIRS